MDGWWWWGVGVPVVDGNRGDGLGGMGVVGVREGVVDGDEGSEDCEIGGWDARGKRGGEGGVSGGEMETRDQKKGEKKKRKKEETTTYSAVTIRTFNNNNNNNTRSPLSPFVVFALNHSCSAHPSTQRTDLSSRLPSSTIRNGSP